MLTGMIADRLQRFGVSLAQTMIWSTALYAVCLGGIAAGLAPASPLLWRDFGLICLTTVLAYPLISTQFPVEKYGRVNALQIGSAHVCTPVTTAHLLHTLLLA